ncbi:hypothetical protein L1887_09957 [Cichorium endivia]|nr:hypothetical protein L1887_09957 [Cichorium endivia]
MTSIRLLHILIAFALLFSSTTLSLDAPEASPSPAPEIGADDLPPLPSPSPSIGSPYMSPPADLAPTLASSPTLVIPPAPEPVEATNTTTANEESDKPKESTSRGMSSGKKAGIVIGVIAAVCVIGFGGMLYKKRKQNIQRAQLGRPVRGDIV